MTIDAFTFMVNQYVLMMKIIEYINKNFSMIIIMITNKILNLLFIKNLYINS